MNKNNIFKICILLPILAITASSCVIKKYNAPEFDGAVDSLYRPIEMQVDTACNTAMIHWSEFFSDTILKGYISTVLNNNLDMLSARKNIEITYAQLRSARALIAPSIGPATLGAGSMYDNGGGFSQPISQIGMGASWEIDIWGKLLSGKRASQAALMASHEGVQALQTTLVSQTAAIYYQIVAFDVQKRIALETIENRAQYLDTIRIMKQTGKVNEVAVQQAVAQLGEVQAALPQIELAIISAENALSILLGKPSVNNLPRCQSLQMENSSMLADLGVPAQMLALRPDVRSAEQRYRNAFELYNVSRAAMYPSLSISATGNMTDLINAQTLTFNLLAGLTQPIFNGRRLRSQKEVADLQQQQAQLGFQMAVLKAGKEVSDAMASQVKTKQRSVAQANQLDAYEKAYEYSFELFVNGYATYLDVLTAQTGVFNTQMALLETYLANLKARIDLYRALGGGAEAQIDQKEIIQQSKEQTKEYKQQRKAQKKQQRQTKK